MDKNTKIAMMVFAVLASIFLIALLLVENPPDSTEKPEPVDHIGTYESADGKVVRYVKFASWDEDTCPPTESMWVAQPFTEQKEWMTLRLVKCDPIYDNPEDNPDYGR